MSLFKRKPDLIDKVKSSYMKKKRRDRVSRNGIDFNEMLKTMSNCYYLKGPLDYSAEYRTRINTDKTVGERDDIVRTLAQDVADMIQLMGFDYTTDTDYITPSNSIRNECHFIINSKILGEDKTNDLDATVTIHFNLGWFVSVQRKPYKKLPFTYKNNVEKHDLFDDDFTSPTTNKELYDLFTYAGHYSNMGQDTTSDDRFAACLAYVKGVHIQEIAELFTKKSIECSPIKIKDTNYMIIKNWIDLNIDKRFTQMYNKIYYGYLSDEQAIELILRK